MPILRNTQKDRFTVIDNKCLENPNLSFEAKGLLAYLLSKPDHWKVNAKELSRSGGCGEERIRRIYKELESEGYLKVEKPRDEKGRVQGQTIVITEPDQYTETRKTRVSDKPSPGKPQPLVNTDEVVNTDDKHVPRKRGPVHISTYLEEQRQRGEKALPDGCAVFKYQRESGIPDDFMTLAWLEFKERQSDRGKRYKDWPRAFLNCVRGNWYRLWWVDESGDYHLTTNGKQANNKHGVVEVRRPGETYGGLVV